jgi:Skp family chaperone for outer membrane proteins
MRKISSTVLVVILLFNGALCALAKSSVRTSYKADKVERAKPITMRIGYFDLKTVQDKFGPKVGLEQAQKADAELEDMAAKDNDTIVKFKAGEKSQAEIDKYISALKRKYPIGYTEAPRKRVDIANGLLIGWIAKAVHSVAPQYRFNMIVDLSNTYVGRKLLLKNGIDITPDVVKEMNAYDFSAPLETPTLKVKNRKSSNAPQVASMPQMVDPMIEDNKKAIQELSPATKEEQSLLEAVFKDRSTEKKSLDAFANNLVELHEYYKKNGSAKKIYLVIEKLHRPLPLFYACSTLAPYFAELNAETVAALIQHDSPELALEYSKFIAGGALRDKRVYQQTVQMIISLLRLFGRDGEIAPLQKLLEKSEESENPKFIEKKRLALFDIGGKLVSYLPYDKVESDGFAGLKMNGPMAGRLYNKTQFRYQFFDRDGKVAISQDFERAHSFSEGLAGVLIKGKWGFINEQGQIVIPPKYDDVSPFSEGLACVGLDRSNDYKYGFINHAGKMVLKPRYDLDGLFFCGIARIGISEGKWGYINKRGKVIFTIGSGGNFQECLAQTTAGFIDTTGQIIIPSTGDIVGDFSEGLARIRKDEKEGYIDRSGKIAIEPKFLYAGDFSEGLASVRVDTNKYHYINKLGQDVFNKSFDYAGEFRNGIAPIKNNDSWGFIDHDGRLLFMLDPKYTLEYQSLFGDRILVKYSVKVPNPNYREGH